MSSERPLPGTAAAEDAPADTATPRRRTPTYMEAVRAPAVEPVPEPRNDKSGPARTRIGLPPVTMLPAQARMRDGEAPRPEPAEVIPPAAASPPPEPMRNDRPANTMLMVPVDTSRLAQPGRVSYEARGPGGAGGVPTAPQVVVNALRIDNSALDRALTPPGTNTRGSRKRRPIVVPAEVLATKHVVPAKRDWRLVVLNQKMLPQAAAIRSLRHRLNDRGDPRVVLITSASTGEGKSFCAANLALALAEVKRSRVLLLEANPHAPTVAEMFGISDPVCVLEQIEEHRLHMEKPWKVTELTTHDLHVLPISPKRKGDEPRTLDGRLLATCIDSLRGAYEYIVVDGPSVDSGPEIPLVEDAADGVILTTRNDKSQAKTLRYAIDQLPPNDLLGVVLIET